MKSAALSGKTGARPALGQPRELAPAVSAAPAGERAPGQQHAIGEALAAQPVEQRARPSCSAFAAETRHQPSRHRVQPLVLRIGEPQPLAQPLGILDHEHAERAEPAHRIGRKPERRLELGHVARSSPAAARRRAPSSSRPASAITASAGTAWAATRSLSISIRTRSRDKLVETARAPRCRRQARPDRARPGHRRRGSGRSAGCADSPRRCACAGSPMKRTRRAARSARPPT